MSTCVQHACQVLANIHILLEVKGQNILKNGQKLEKIGKKSKMLVLIAAFLFLKDVLLKFT